MHIIIIACLSDSYNEMILKTPYEEEEEAIDEQYIDEDINMDDIMQPSPITTGNTTGTPNPSPWKRQMKTVSWLFSN